MLVFYLEYDEVKGKIKKLRKHEAKKAFSSNKSSL